MSARLNRRGAILPLTILMLAIMGVAVAITYVRISSERRTTSDAQAQMQAFAVAQSGLARYMSTLAAGGVKPGWGDVDVVYNDLPGGTATVSLRMVRDSTTTLLPAVYAITSRGVNTAARRYGSSAPAAERSVATYALWTPAPFEMYGAMTSLSGIVKNGGSGSLSGYDRCGVAPTIHGVAVPGGQYSGPVGPINGDPEDTPYDLGTPGIGGTAKDSIDIDWAGIVAWPNTTMWPDFKSPAWPNAGAGEFLDWPIVRVDNAAGPDFELPAACVPGACKGILIVTGNLTLSGGVGWEGLILAGGKLVSNGNNQVYGATVSGLNIKLGIDPGPSDIANGTKTFQYDSCALKRALGQYGSIQRVRNGWTDTWPSY
jgi:type II secretory pathway pseudopilin PulG